MLDAGDGRVRARALKLKSTDKHKATNKMLMTRPKRHVMPAHQPLRKLLQRHALHAVQQLPAPLDHPLANPPQPQRRRERALRQLLPGFGRDRKQLLLKHLQACFPAA